MPSLWILIAGPYTTGASSEEGRAHNLRALNEIAFDVWRLGHLPIIGVNIALPVIEAAGREHFDELMMPMSLRAAERCDAVLRVGGASSGADREVEQVRQRGGRVFYSVSEIPPVSG